MPPSLPPRRITLLVRETPTLFAFCAVGGLLAGAAGRWLGLKQPYMSVAGLAFAYTAAAAVSAWRARPESWPRWWLAVLLFWAIGLGVVWLPRHFAL